MLGTALLASPSAAWAQDTASAEAPVSDEIIVTALKRNQSLQTVPTTVSVVGGDALATANVASIEQLTSIVPGVRIQNAPAGLVNPMMRGLGSSPTASNRPSACSSMASFWAIPV
nr:TonB-dependent receptor plug domain-containing protein [Sphingobium terrigena]